MVVRQELVTETTVEIRQRNPFATRWVRPGAVKYSFAPGMDTAQLIDKLQGGRWRGAIVGRHGTGKSTLLATLVPLIEQMGIDVGRISLRDGQKCLTPEALRGIRWLGELTSTSGKVRHGLPNGLLVVDGYEQLGWWARRRVSAICRRNGWGLLVTAHRDSSVGGISAVFRTTSELATVQYLVERVLPSHGGLIHPGDVAAAFDAQSGNVRETLFALYDLFEERRRQSDSIIIGL
jgi:hypothetical protein